MNVLPSPDGGFHNLADYSFQPNYSKVNDGALGPLRPHYVDEGNIDGLAVIMLHGEPNYLCGRLTPF